jgi:DNA-binding NarL/FixJ family response regulator
MKSDENLRSIPVVVLTSSREAADLSDFYRNGVNAYVVKPMVFSEFINAVRQLGAFWAAVNEPPPTGADDTAQHRKGSAPPGPIATAK